MLTATYSFLAIHAEQRVVRGILARVMQYAQARLARQPMIEIGTLDEVLRRVAEFDAYWRARKVDAYLMPALRGMSAEVDHLMSELDATAEAARQSLTRAFDGLQRALEQGGITAGELLPFLEQYGRDVAARFAREEEALFPLAERWLSNDAWFAIGAQLLSDNDAHRSHRRVPPPALPQVVAMV